MLGKALFLVEQRGGKEGQREKDSGRGFRFQNRPEALPVLFRFVSRGTEVRRGGKKGCRGRASGKSGVKRFQNVRDFEKAGMTLKGRFSRAAAACFSWNRTYKGAVLSRSWKIGLPAFEAARKRIVSRGTG